MEQKDSWLRTLFRNHRRRMLVSAAIALSGSLLLVGGVSGLGMEPWQVSIVLSPLMTVVSFFANWHFVWPDRGITLGFGLAKWMLKWAGMAPVSQTGYAWLTEHHDVNYLKARIAVAAVLGLPSYIISNWLVFSRWNRQRVAAALRRAWVLTPWRLKAEKA